MVGIPRPANFTRAASSIDSTAIVDDAVGAVDVANTLVHDLDAKTTPVGADSIMISDSEDSYANKEVTITNLMNVVAGTQASTGLTDATGVLTVSPADNAITIGADSLVYMTAAGVPKKDLASDVATAMAGTATTTGLAASSGVLSATLGYTEADVDVANDDFIFRDHSGSHAPKTEAIADLVTAEAGTETTSGLTATSGVLKASLGYTDASIDVANDDIVFRDHNDSHNPKTEAVADLVSFIGGTASTTGLSNSAGVLTVAARLAHMVADQKSSLFFTAAEFDASTTSAVDTKLTDSLEAKGQLVGVIGIVNQLFNGTADSTVIISKAASGATPMSSNILMDKDSTQLVGSVVGAWPVSGADSIQTATGDVYAYVAGDASRSTGKIGFILLWMVTA